MTQSSFHLPTPDQNDSWEEYGGRCYFWSRVNFSFVTVAVAWRIASCSPQSNWLNCVHPRLIKKNCVHPSLIGRIGRVLKSCA